MDKLFLIPDVKNLLKIKIVSTDNTVFRLHYRLTSLFLLCATLMISATQFFGNPINCIVPDKFPESVVESYCWIESTFSLPHAFDKVVGEEVPYPGVDKHVEGNEKVVHSYYQWVCVVLFIQAVLFLIPRYLWKSWEGGKMSNLLMELHNPTLDPSARKEKYKKLCCYFVEQERYHNDYFLKFFLCEILNFVNVVGQIFMIDRFLHGEFTTYGSEVFQFTMQNQEDRKDPMIRVFPRMTKCVFHHYGPSGDVQKLDTYCVLPLNILNEKVYVFVWFWFVILSVLTALALVYRLVLRLSSKARYNAIKWFNFLTDARKLDAVLSYLGYGDWFVLYMLSRNMENTHFKELVEAMHDSINDHLEKHLPPESPQISDSFQMENKG